MPTLLKITRKKERIYAKRAAPDWNRSFEQHLVALLAHGIAHLLNYNHKTDVQAEVMQEVERKLLKL